MTKFIGVISNSASSPSDDRVLEFEDLELLANYLFDETENLFHEFQRKAQFINEMEILVHNVSNKITEIYDNYQLLKKTTIEIEQDIDDVGFWLCRMENSINCMEKFPKDFVACKCTSNLERNKMLTMLVAFSDDCTNIQQQVHMIENYEKEMPVVPLFDFNTKWLPFLDLHVTILESIDKKLDKITDMVKIIDEMFINAHKRLTTACYHKPRHEYASDC